ncbi:unnamed protein product [Mytilus coruscus]|uniref:Uncharacterized protein n=1 Tax=Mytilus coruscus TaxID=42192 RepID=A0A6J8BI37_MYTCO|nr:unnamed protein product [Mytilus coruscus]
MNKILDELYIKVLGGFVSLDSCEFKVLQAVCHRSCYKSYTNKQNCFPFKCEEASNQTFNDDRQSSDCCPSVSGVLATLLVDDLSAASQLKADLKIFEMQASMSTVIDTNKERILHSAASIHRKNTETLQISTEEYPTSDELSLPFSMQSLLSSLLQFNAWLLDDTAYSQVYSHNMAPEKS